MTGPEADEVGRRLAIHLRRNNFEACGDILSELEAELGRASKLEAIAELPIDLRTVNLLEKAGYVYLRDLEGVDVSELSIVQLGPVAKAELKWALEDLAEQDARKVAECL